MNDDATTIAELKAIIKTFVEERDWQQFHTPKNMSMLIATEAAELMEIFLWSDGSLTPAQELKNRQREIENEVADLLFTVLNFAMRCNIDISAALERKMVHNREKYPVEKVKGKSLKYTAYQ